MVILSNSDMFEVRINSLLADYDRETLTNLYQPIIGYTALAVYFTLWSECNIQKILSLSSHEQFLARMKLAPGHFVDARKVLEAVGLVKTRLEKAPGTHIYHYELNSPKTPKGFFADTLLYGMLIQALGENDANRLKRVYEIDNTNEEGEDISSSFNDVFHPDFEDPSFIAAATSKNNTVGRNKIKIDMEFSYEKFFNELSNISQINEKGFAKKEIKEIERLASLYGIDEVTMANVVANNYDPYLEKGSRVNIEAVNEALKVEVNYSVINRKYSKSQVSGDTQLASKINLFENKTPMEVLRYLQNGTKVAPSDAKIIYVLANDYKLPNGVISVIVDFVLNMNDNILVRAYAEKIAAQFNREGIETTVDAMNYCNRILEEQSKRKKSRGRKSSSENYESADIKQDKKIAKGKISSEEWNKLFDEEKGEQNNGETDTDLPF